jgi:hypothetical protein
MIRNLTSKSSGLDDDDDTTVIVVVVCWWCTALLRAMDSSFGLIQFDGFELNRIPVIAEFKQLVANEIRLLMFSGPEYCREVF